MLEYTFEDGYLRPDDVEDYHTDNCQLYGIVTEASSVSLQTGYIYICESFPFNEQSRNGSVVAKRRPIVILPGLHDSNLYAYMIGSIHNEPTRRKAKYPTNQILHDWKTEGLDKPSFFLSLVFRDPKKLSIRPIAIGKLSDSDMKLIKQRMEFAKTSYWANPFSLLDWLKSYINGWTTHPSGNNNLNKIQTRFDIEKTHKVNCVDVAALVRNSSVIRNFENTIVLTQFITNTEYKGRGHVYCCFKMSSTWYVFHFIPDPMDGVIISYNNTNNINQVVEKYSHDELADHFTKYHKDRKPSSFILNEHELSVWDDLVDKSIVQKDLIELLQFITAIKRLNTVLINYDWALVVNGKTMVPYDNWDVKKYRTVDPNIFELIRAGCCWDYVLYEQEWFKKNFPFIKTRLYYAEGGTTGRACQTHTWISFEISNDPYVYIFEAAFKKHAGIHKFSKNAESGFSAMENSVTYWFMNVFPNPTFTGVVYEVTKPIRKGMNTEEFMAHCIRNGKIVYKKGDYLERFIQPFIDNHYKFVES